MLALTKKPPIIPLTSLDQTLMQMPADQLRIEFSPVARTDFAMLRKWLEEPLWQEWWGDPETEMSYIEDMVAGGDTTKPYIFRVNGKPTGYIQKWFIGDHHCEPWITHYPWLKELPANAAGVDLSIGIPEKVSQGIGSAVLAAFVENLLKDGRRTIIIDPHPENHRAIRAYTKAGFKIIPELVGKTADSLIMRYGPNKSEVK